MTNEEIILSLDAVLIVVRNSDLSEPLKTMCNDLSDLIAEDMRLLEEKYPDFESFLDAQKKAVIELSQSKKVFGE